MSRSPLVVAFQVHVRGIPKGASSSGVEDQLTLKVSPCPRVRSIGELFLWAAFFTSILLSPNSNFEEDMAIHKNVSSDVGSQTRAVHSACLLSE